MAVFERQPDGTLLRVEVTDKCMPCSGATTAPPAPKPDVVTPAAPDEDDQDAGVADQPVNDDKEVETDGTS